MSDVIVNLEAATAMVKDLFGYPCSNGRIARWTMDWVVCGECKDCTRDWTPEAKAIVEAAVGPVE